MKNAAVMGPRFRDRNRYNDSYLKKLSSIAVSYPFTPGTAGGFLIVFQILADRVSSFIRDERKANGAISNSKTGVFDYFLLWRVVKIPPKSAFINERIFSDAKQN